MNKGYIELKELAAGLRSHSEEMMPGIGTNLQKLDNGKEYACCLLCGLSSLRLAEALEALSNESIDDQSEAKLKEGGE